MSVALHSALSFLSRLSSSIIPFLRLSSLSHPLVFRLAKATTEGRASSLSLSLSLSLFSPFLPSPSPLYSSIVRDALAPSCLSIYPSLSSPSAGLPFASFSASLFLSRFLSLLRIYRGEQRMWMGWVSPRLGERSITCEPKGEEIRGCAAYLQERNGAEHKPEWWNTAEHARTVCPTPPLSLSLSRTLFSRPSFFLSALSSLPPLSFSRHSCSLRAERAAGYPS